MFALCVASTFDFSDMAGDHNDDDDEKQDTSDVGDPSGATPEDLAIFKRDRAFSFEFFSFAGDDLLPSSVTNASSELPDPASMDEHPVMSRPRGDSIIFDPVSFQDGGIHEQNAILKVNAANHVELVPGGELQLLADPRLAAPPTHAHVPPQPRIPPSATPNPLPAYSAVPSSTQAAPVPSTTLSSSGQIATLPSGLTGGTPNASSPATFQMELLNKDGRIGIYLPEARKARIARFHAKRKMRIWRKRIKYDCRKKLADSRPRIKGRFVKRSDMDD